MSQTGGDLLRRSHAKGDKTAEVSTANYANHANGFQRKDAKVQRGRKQLTLSAVKCEIAVWKK